MNSVSVFIILFSSFLHYDCLVSSQAIQNIKSLLYVSSTVEKYKSPLGTRDNPATSCKDLMYSDNYQDGGWGVPFFGSSNCFRSVWKLTIWRRQSSLNWVGPYLTVTLYEMVGFQNFKLFSSGFSYQTSSHSPLTESCRLFNIVEISLERSPNRNHWNEIIFFLNFFSKAFLTFTYKIEIKKGKKKEKKTHTLI